MTFFGNGLFVCVIDLDVICYDIIWCYDDVVTRNHHAIERDFDERFGTCRYLKFPLIQSVEKSELQISNVN